jgi:hypothetical protein
MKACYLLIWRGMASQRLSDKKLRGKLTVKENLYGQSAKAAAKADKVCAIPPSIVLALLLHIFKFIFKLAKTMRGFKS